MKKSDSHKISSIDFDLRQLEIFQKVVELRSFSKAANVVFLAQASVSERIATLENLVGAKLLDRLGREVVPTRVGEILYKHAILLLGMKRTACFEIQEFLGLKQGEINIGGSTIPGEYIFPSYLASFRKKYPAISIHLTIADTGKIKDMVLCGDLELGIIGSKIKDSNLIQHEIWDDELVVAVPTNHPLAKNKRVSLDAIKKEPIILREMSSGTQKIMEQYLQSLGMDDTQSLTIAARLGTSTAVKEGVKTGLGIAILSLRAIKTELATGVLKAIKIKGINMSRNFYLIRDKRRIASPLCQAMVDFLLSTA